MLHRLTLEILRLGADKSDRVFDLRVGDVITIGSGPGCECVLEAAHIQPIHVRLTATEAGIEVLDCVGSGEVSVNNRRIWHGMVNAHDVIRLGDVKIIIAAYTHVDPDDEDEETTEISLSDRSIRESNATWVEVRCTIGDTLWRVDHFAGPEGLFIGDRPGDILFMCGTLPVAPFPLLRFIDQHPVLCVAVGMSGHMTVQGMTYSLEEAVASGFATPESDFEDAWRIDLDEHTGVQVEWAGVVFDIKMVEPEVYVAKRSWKHVRAPVAIDNSHALAQGVLEGQSLECRIRRRKQRRRKITRKV